MTRNKSLVLSQMCKGYNVFYLGLVSGTFKNDNSLNGYNSSHRVINDRPTSVWYFRSLKPPRTSGGDPPKLSLRIMSADRDNVTKLPVVINKLAGTDAMYEIYGGFSSFGSEQKCKVCGFKKLHQKSELKN
uniref:Uncharacterized protein n=1 Tax=Glossina pallidipes TaxID=7398 RepID=A0A1A9ZJ96_GLOPL